MDPNDPETKQRVGDAGRMSAIGLELGGAVILGLVGGWWLDRRFGTAPVLALIGLLLGTFAGFATLFRALKKSQAEEEQLAKRERSEGEDRP